VWHFLILPSPRQRSRKASHETNPRNVSRTGKSPVASMFSILRRRLGQACRLPPSLTSPLPVAAVACTTRPWRKQNVRATSGMKLRFSNRTLNSTVSCDSELGEALGSPRSNAHLSAITHHKLDFLLHLRSRSQTSRQSYQFPFIGSSPLWRSGGDLICTRWPDCEK
jgi:hypothetical protein